jgi:transcriptional regulator with XRE-family HTH domain
MPNAILIGEKIKKLREEKNISRDSFCDTVGISLSALENGTF